MATMKDVKIPKKYLKKDHLSFYKAYCVEGDDELEVDQDYDVYGLDYVGAMQQLMDKKSEEEVLAFIGKQIAFVVFDVDFLTLKTKDLVDPKLGELFFAQNQLSLTLKGKPFKMRIEDNILEDLKYEMDPKNEIKVLTELSLRRI